MAGVDRAQPIVEGQDEVRQDRPDEREHQRVGRDRRQRLADVLQPQVAEFALHDVDRADQQAPRPESPAGGEPSLLSA